ncbi:Xaa-Pro peptidase family protein, partial [Desulfosarcina sp. OttesenSCG-928-A07]|nr:Xaa-Pro peptidase family protein [Desulfosarcina sp. OttesenSCG-928-A07]
GVLGIECDVMPATLYLKLTKLFGDFSIVDMSGIIFHQRMEKDESEIAAIRKACEIMDAGHHRVMETLVPGMTEIELAAEVEYAHRRAGHEGILAMRNFDFYISRGPLCSGDNLFKVSGFSNTITGVGASPAVPAGPSHRKINTGDLVIVDIPTCWKGYHSDQTRTYVLGDPSNEIRDLFQKLRMICDSAVSFLKDGVTSRELFETARKTAEELGVGEYFLGLDPRKGNFIGHGIGLDANEPPVLFDHSDFPLRKDYVLTIEIHLTHPDHGAVKLEDVVRVRENDCERLTLTPRELFGVQVH